MLTNDVYQQLLKIVGDKKITRDSAELSYWGKDSTQFSANASAIIFPQNIEQLQAIVQPICRPLPSNRACTIQ